MGEDKEEEGSSAGSMKFAGFSSIEEFSKVKYNFMLHFVYIYIFFLKNK